MTHPVPVPVAARRPDDAGVAVYWSVQSGGRQAPRVMACDRWDDARDNMRAIGLAIDGLRAIERSGASQVLERAYEGFNALPPPSVTHPRRSWREVMGFGESTLTTPQIRQRFRELAKSRHPDGGGSDEAFRELVRARDEALAQIRGAA